VLPSTKAHYAITAATSTTVNLL